MSKEKKQYSPSLEDPAWQAFKATVTPLQKNNKGSSFPPPPLASPPYSRHSKEDSTLSSSVSPPPLTKNLPKVSPPSKPLPQDEASTSKNFEAQTYRHLSRGHYPLRSRLDLHGYRLKEAHEALLAFLKNAYERQERFVLVITGKGLGAFSCLQKNEDRFFSEDKPGKIRHALPLWLQTPPLKAIVTRFETAHLRHGGQGAWYIALKRSSKKESGR